MRKFTIIFGLILTMTWVTAIAAVDENMSVAVEDSGAAMVSPLSGTPRYIGDLPQYTVTAPATPAKAYRGAKVKTISSTSDLAGDYVLSYQNYDTTGYDGGNLVEISAVTGTDSILIDNFYGYAVKAKVDISTMTIAIPCTYLDTTAYGEVYLTYFDADSCTYSTNTNIIGTITSDGNITFTTGWGIIIVSGDNAGYSYNLANPGSTIEKVNATFTYECYDTSNATTDTATVKVVVTQENDSILKVKNFYGMGATIEILLLPSKAATIEKQYVLYNSTYSTGCYIVGAMFNDAYTTMTSYTPLLCNTATDNRTISWGQWTMIYTYSSKSYYILNGVNGKIETDFDIVYPTGTTLSLSGDGTADSPYLIASATDWNAMADYMAINGATMDGKYIQLTADIDFSDTTAKVLGYDGTPFRGDLDGNGKTIKIAATAESTYSAPLIYITRSGAYIHNFTLEGTYTTSYNYCGGLVGSLYNATIDNVTVNLKITTTATNTGGLTGYIYLSNINNCTFTGEITATSTYAAGLVGKSMYSTITNCSNKGSVYSTKNYAAGVVSYTGSYTSVTNCCNDSTGSVIGNQYTGGVVSYLYTYSSADSCYNYGMVSASGTYSGGIVGYNYFQCTVSNCYNYGTVTLTANYGAGVVGYNYSSSTVSNCYNYGTVSSSGTYAAGVVGLVKTGTCFVENCCNYGTVSSTSTYSGGVIGALTNGTASDCYNYGTVSSSGTYPAGIIGEVNTGCIVENCGNYGSVTYTGSTASCYASGCIGRAYYGTYTKVFNEGTVSATSSSANYISGVFGYLYSNSTAYIITDCYNTADITANAYVAGLIANVYTSTGVTMTNCYNTGNITSTSTATSTYPTAGLIAYYPKGSTFTNCWNSGTITSNGLSQTGGLFGVRKNANSSTYPITIKGCYNTGNIVSAGTIVGGLIGVFQSDYSTIDSCYNTGNVTGGNYTGGIIGNLYGDETQVTNCWNSGDVISTGICVGGCVGQSFVKVATITNCFNTGDVTSTSTYVGGIIGRSSASLFNTYNTGTVTGSQYVGGVVGIPYTTTIISGAYSTGKVVATADSAAYFGNIIGISTTDTTVWISDYEITNAYYLSTNASSDAQEDNLSTALSYAQLGALQLPDSAWTAGDNYTYPRLTTLADNDYAKAHAAAVIPADGDSYSSITTGFNVGTPDGVTWTASSGSVEIDGNNVTFSESFSGTLTMTATSGDVSVATELTCNVVVSGISDITGASREVVEETFYNLAGAQVAEPAEDSKAIYIVVKSYSDGTTETVKEVR